jgi:hypothetical protein
VSAPDGTFDDLADRLDAMGDELADLALEHLRVAVGTDDEAALAAAKDAERRVTKARRRIVEAAALLRG